MSDSEIKAVADSVACTNYLWAVGELPFYLYAAAKPDASLDDVERLLIARGQGLVADEPSYATAMQVQMLARQLSQQASRLVWDQAQSAVRMAAKQMGVDGRRVLSIALCQFALNWGMADRLLGPEPTRSTSELSSLTDEKLRNLLAHHLAADKRFVTRLMPDRVSR